jgi:hypothetical protein
MDINPGVRIGPFEVFLPLQAPSGSLRQRSNPEFPGRLFIVEGIDGSGKSTQLSLLHKWLEAKGYGVVFSEWNSSPLVKDTTKHGKKKKLLTPATFSLIHATDFADRTDRSILPLLKAGAIVLCDRYVYTAFARDVANGSAASTDSRRGPPSRSISGCRSKPPSRAWWERATDSSTTKRGWIWS